MKLRYFSFFLFLVILSSCKKESNTGNSFIGRWQETETYMSMGGPANWVTSTVYREIEFKPDGRLIGLPDVNKYRFLNDSTIEVWSTSGIYRFDWRIQELTREKLELSYSCFEGCGSRFVAVK